MDNTLLKKLKDRGMDRVDDSVGNPFTNPQAMPADKLESTYVTDTMTPEREAALKKLNQEQFASQQLMMKMAQENAIREKVNQMNSQNIDPAVGLPNTEVDPNHPEVYSAIEPPQKFGKIRKALGR